MTLLIRSFSFTWLAFIIFVTLSPIELRPGVAENTTEHIAAFALLTFLMAMSFPRHWVAAIAVCALAAAGLELAQLIVPGRHGRMIDFVVKIFGCGLGSIAFLALKAVLDHWGFCKGS